MKYSSSVEELKKLNNLWSEQAMFSRATLIVPCANDAERLKEDRRCKVDLFLQIVGEDDYEQEAAGRFLGKYGWVVKKVKERERFFYLLIY
jgi:hypothetical protein